MFSANSEQTEEHIEKQDKVLNQLENKRKMVMDFISKGEKLMEDPNCPKFLEGHVKKLREAWDDTQEKAQSRKKALVDNMTSWETFEGKKRKNHLIIIINPSSSSCRDLLVVTAYTHAPAEGTARLQGQATSTRACSGMVDRVP